MIVMPPAALLHPVQHIFSGAWGNIMGTIYHIPYPPLVFND